jgi:ferrochelatase
MTAPLGVLVMAHGTPARPEEIAAFYTRIRRGRPPTDEQLADLVRRYEAIGGLSPLTERTDAQVDALRAALQAHHPGRYLVAYGAKHAAPLIEDGAATLLGAEVSAVIGLVLTPHGSSMGSGEYHERARAAVGATPYIEVPPWYGAPALVQLLAVRVTDALASQPAGSRTRCPVVFTAHSLPERILQMGDAYPDQLEESARLVAEAAGLTRWSVAWQSAGRTPEPWLGPDIRAVITELGAEDGIDAVVVCPIGFVSDHLEVLYDIDVQAAAGAEAVGVTLVRTASLNADPRFIAVLAQAVVDATTTEDS